MRNSKAIYVAACVFLCGLIASPSSARAACFSPVAASGSLVFNSASKVMQYCNPTMWVQIGHGPLGGSGCSTPVGSIAGNVVYNLDHRVIQYCNGQEWVPWGPIDGIGTGSGNGNCSTPAGKGGDIHYNTDYGVMEYCDGATWEMVVGLPPSLSMDFVNNIYSLQNTSYSTFIGFLTAAGGTFTRSSTAMYFNAAGIMVSATTNTPRFDYDPVTHTARGILIEEARTNGYLYSSNFTNANWVQGTPSGLTLTANATIAPDGTMTATSLNPNGVGQPWFGTTIGPTWSAGQTVTRSVYAKAGGGTVVAFEQKVAGTFSDTYFNLATGVITPASGITASMQNIGNGWYRLIATRTFASKNNANNSFDVFWVDCQCTSGTPGHNVYLWGAQFEIGAIPTSYIPTTTAAATRQRETLSMPLGSWFNSGTGTLFAQATIPYFGTAGWPGTVSIDDGTSNDSIDMFVSDHDSDGIEAEIYVGNSGTFDVVAGPNALAGVSFKQTMTWGQSNASAVSNGIASSPQATTIPATVNVLRVGDLRGGNQPLNGWVQRIQYYPALMSTSRLQTMTK